MAFVPRLLRPSVLIRRKAMYAGFLGSSNFWKFVGLFVFGKSTIAKFFGKQAEVIDMSKLGSGRVMQIATAQPISKRRRRKLAKRGMPVPTLAEQRVSARAWASDQAVRKVS